MPKKNSEGFAEQNEGGPKREKEEVEVGMFTGGEIRALILNALGQYKKTPGILLGSLLDKMRQQAGQPSGLTEQVVREIDRLTEDANVVLALALNWQKIPSKARVDLAKAVLRAFGPTCIQTGLLQMGVFFGSAYDPRARDPQGRLVDNSSGFFPALLNSVNPEPRKGSVLKVYRYIVDDQILGGREGFGKLELSAEKALELVLKITRGLESLDFDTAKRLKLARLQRRSYGEPETLENFNQRFLDWREKEIDPAIKVLEDWEKQQT